MPLKQKIEAMRLEIAALKAAGRYILAACYEQALKELEQQNPVTK